THLPTAMIPTYLTHLTHLPQLPNGKTDHKQLPSPTRVSGDRVSVAPRTTDELVIAELWSEVLGVRDIGVQDDFYDVGGDSLRAVQMFQLLSDVGSPVPLAVLLGNHTIEQLAAGPGGDTESSAALTTASGADAGTDSSVDASPEALAV
ncbi:phosphopantetheine-binding protein, partial [Streptomyces sp. NPDC060000]|uniref:phosphopantetheine-binding protein n=1 Tax=Streptomyces sp. NPDC060000 TaxID=3347031 RepID=UPI00368E820B